MAQSGGTGAGKRRASGVLRNSVREVERDPALSPIRKSPEPYRGQPIDTSKSGL
jgi:hypothetical protein